MNRVVPTTVPYDMTSRFVRRQLQRMRGRKRSPHGLKRWFVPGSEYGGPDTTKKGTLTRYAAKERRRRRVVGKIARRSRQRNYRGR